MPLAENHKYINMRTKNISLIALSLWLAFIHSAFSQELWHGTTFGMTEEQVKDKVPGLVTPAKPDTLYGGITESLRLNGVDLAGIPLLAKFYFKREGLRQVTLETKEQRRFSLSLDAFDTLKKQLRQQYGTESFTKSHRGGPDQEEAIWVKGESRVRLFLGGVLGKAILNISYQSTKADSKEDPEVALAAARTLPTEEQSAILLDFKKQAEAGDADAQIEYASLLGAAQGVGQFNPEAVDWIRKAADQNQPKAQVLLGGMYSNGSGGMPQDMAKAAEYLRKAADQGEAMAQNALGAMYAVGNGVPQDSAQAVKWFRKAAEQGYSLSQLNLGHCLQRGRGVETNLVQAVEWYRKAAENDYPEAQFYLGNCYRDGNGIGKDPLEAYAWYGVAARRYVDAVFERNAVARAMTPEQVAAAKQRMGALKAQILSWKTDGRPVSGSTQP
jgi:TPR repeat protein